mmetsp:Transcript_26136/g.26365  ORF Transcript_26136/g.26365 Transcript_26136/m.26365 type:complete len:371 (+) Transcript_26136:93-1205(+)
MKTRLIASVLQRLYPNPPVPLNNYDTFTFLVAVVLSAQTTDGKVNEVTKELFRVGRTPEDMMKLDVSLVRSIIQPVGLAPKKASYIVGLSKEIVERFDGKVPCTLDELISLPGVGRKTASVVMSQSFGTPAFAVDTHVHRLALRWGLSKEQKNVDKVQRDLCEAFPENEWNTLHLQMIYFGREYCPAKNHEAAKCPICSWVNSNTSVPDSLHHFTPQKPGKGIVFYGDRASELQENPQLAANSPSPSPSQTRSGSVSESQVVRDVSLKDSSFNLESELLTPVTDISVKEEKEISTNTPKTVSTTAEARRSRRQVKKESIDVISSDPVETATKKQRTSRKRKVNTSEIKAEAIESKVDAKKGLFEDFLYDG